MHGFGKLYAESGYYYEGEFKEDLEDGKGKIFDKNGKWYLKAFLRKA